MLAVYNRMAASLRQNEGFGDSRVNLHITLATAVMGGLVVLVTGGAIDSVEVLILAIAVGVLAVLAIGASTLLRIIERNLQTDQYIRAIGSVGQFFVLNQPSIKPFLNEFDPFRPRRPRSQIIKLTSLATGGLLQTVAILNSLIAASLPLFVALAISISSDADQIMATGEGRWDYILLMASAVLLGVGGWWLQIAYTKRRYQADENERSRIGGMIEIETTLLVCSSKPGDVLDRIAELRSVSDFTLVPQPSHLIEDTYFDLKNRELDAKKLALRIREIDGKRLITLKGPAKIDRAGVGERMELELEWSRDGLRKVIKEISRWDIKTCKLPKRSEFETPDAVLNKLGFEVIQQRVDRRRVRNVFLGGDTVNLLAEVAIDSLTFNFQGSKAHHSAVEFEAKSDAGVRVLASLAQELENEFLSELVQWPHSKLAIGLVVEQLAESGELGALLDRDDNLTPQAYPRIDAEIWRRGQYDP